MYSFDEVKVFDPELAEKISKKNLMRRKLLEQYIRGTLPPGTMFHKMLANNDIPALWRIFGTDAVKYDNMLKEPVQPAPEVAASFAKWDAIYSMEADFAAKQLAKENPAQAFIDAFVAKNGAITEEQRTRLLALFGRMNPAKVETEAEIIKEKEFGTAGDFSAANLARQLGGSIQERIAKATEKTAEETEKMAQYVTGGGSLLTYQ